jgi:hypothetical protein
MLPVGTLNGAGGGGVSKCCEADDLHGHAIGHVYRRHIERGKLVSM